MVAAAAKRATSVKTTPEEAAAHAAALSLVQVQYKNWDVVWSRMAGFPWWPGIVFLDWDVVRDAELPLPKVLLEINPPEQREVTVTIHGKQEVRTVTDRFCLVMFLDKGDWFAANMTTQVQPFTSYYNANFKPSHKRGKTAGFRQALHRAIKLLHLSNEHTEEELMLFNTPPQEKRRRVEPKIQPKKQSSGGRGGDPEWEDEYESSEHDDDDDADFEIEKPVLPAKLKSRGKTSRKLDAEFSGQTVASAKQSGKKPKQAASRQNSVAVIHDDEADRKVSGKGRKKLASKAIPVAEISHAAAQVKDSLPQKKAPKKKVSSKRVQDEAIDVSSRSESSKKLAEVDVIHRIDKRTKEYRQQLNSESKNGTTPGKKVSAKKKKTSPEVNNGVEDAGEDDGDVEFIENPNRTKDDNSAGDSAPAQSSTPLSQIWTTHVDEKQDSSSGDAKKTLVYKQDFVWDEELFTNNEEVAIEKREDEDELISSARDRPLGKRQMRSVQQSHIRQNLMTGNLDPHTMVQCESYRSKYDSENLNSRSRGSSSLEPPFNIQVHPDAVFVCDLHAHLATCEIIGFLGGRWDEVTKTLYIQAAFPCRSLMIDGDDGSTDVEMDPGSEIELREIIQNAQLEVVGWYHSHPAFAPDPSIRDIENQTSYQQLFQRRIERQTKDQKSVIEISEPFVGLIVGTYDTKRDTPVSLFRYFHTRGEKVSGGARREIFMPYELVPTRRHYRAVLSAEQRAETSSLTMYPSIFEHFFGKQSATGRKSVELLNDDDGMALAFAGIDSVAPSSKKDAQSKKRKLSSDFPVKEENLVKKVKGKRGRKRKTDLIKSVDDDGGRIDLTGNDVESPVDSQPAVLPPPIEVDGADDDGSTIFAEPEASSSAPDTQVAQSAKTIAAEESKPGAGEAQVGETEQKSQGDVGVVYKVEPEVVAIVEKSSSVVETNAAAEPPSTEAKETVEIPETKQRQKEVTEVSKETEQKRQSTSFDTAVKRRSRRNQSLPDTTADLVDTRPVTINLVDEDEVDTEAKPKEIEVAEAISLSPPSFVLDSNNGVSSGRRRGRKPVQTQKKSTTFFNSASARDDRSSHNSQSATVATEIAVYGAFGSASGVTMAGAEKENGVLEAKIKNESSFTNVVVTPASEGDYVFLQFSTSPNDEKDVALADQEALKLEAISPVPTSIQDVKEELSAQVAVEGKVIESSDHSDIPPTPVQDGKELPPQETTEEQQIQDDGSGLAGNKMSPNSPQSRLSTEAVSVTMDIDDRDSIQTPSAAAEIGDDEALRGSSPPRSAVEESISMEIDGGDTPRGTSKPLSSPVEDAADTGKKIDDRAGVSHMQEQIIVVDGPVNLDSAPKPAGGDDQLAKRSANSDSKEAEKEPAPQSSCHEVSAVSEASSSVALPVVKREDAATLTPDAAAEAEVCEESPLLLVNSSQTIGQRQEVAFDVKPFSGYGNLIIISATEQASSDVPSRVASSDLLEDKVVKPEANGDVVMTKPQAQVQHEEQQQSAKQEVLLSPPETVISTVPVVEPASTEASQVDSSGHVEEKDAVKSEKDSGIEVAEPSQAHVTQEEQQQELVQEEAALPSLPTVMLFGSGRQVEDIRTSLDRIKPLMEKMKEIRETAAAATQSDAQSTTTESNATDGDAGAGAKTEAKLDTGSESSLLERQQAHLHSLRTKYGDGISGCAEQVITLVDYYRDFERRIDLNETWKTKVNKLSKIEASMSEYVRYVNLPVHLRQEFVQPWSALFSLTKVLRTGQLHSPIDNHAHQDRSDHVNESAGADRNDYVH